MEILPGVTLAHLSIMARYLDRVDAGNFMIVPSLIVPSLYRRYARTLKLALETNPAAFDKLWEGYASAREIKSNQELTAQILNRVNTSQLESALLRAAAH